jgi:hypothetical protein
VFFLQYEVTPPQKNSGGVTSFLAKVQYILGANISYVKPVVFVTAIALFFSESIIHCKPYPSECLSLILHQMGNIKMASACRFGELSGNTGWLTKQ